MWPSSRLHRSSKGHRSEPITNVPDPAAVAIGVVAGLVAGSSILVMARGLPSSAVLVAVGSDPVRIVLHLMAASALGGLIGRAVPCRPRGHAAVASGGALIGLLWWLIGPLTIVPLLTGDGPTWSAEAASDGFPGLVSAVLFGALAGVLSALISAVTGHQVASVAEPGERQQPGVDRATRVVILGGGFGGVAAARRLEESRPHRLGLDVTLVASSNSLLFTPMLAEVAGSSLEPQHISSPIRASVPRTRFVRASVSSIDTEAKVIHLDGSSTRRLDYDHLVLALGSVPAFRDLPGIEEHGRTLKSLDDATGLRNHAIGMLELADACPDPEERRRLLTFVVAGGGFAGTETVAELFDLAHSTLRYYPNVPVEELRFILVHSSDRILPEIGPELADYALGKLEARGIEFALGVRIVGATAAQVCLADGRSIPTRTLIWTAGNRPNPLLASLPGPHVGDGALRADATMAVPGLEGVWAIGDNASIPDPHAERGTSPPTAQHALRQGKKVADNVVATVLGRAPSPFRFKPIGTLVALGHRTAVAEIRGLRFSGLVAWMMWRAIYLTKLPGLEQKTRVLLDWVLDLLFPRDITLTEVPSALVGPGPVPSATGEDDG